MRKQLIAEAHGQRANIAWLSLQPDGSISFGLNDRAFCSPRAFGNIPIFNAYNRVRSAFLISSDGTDLHPVRNPHFTYHPIAMLHLKGNGDQELFRGLLDTTIVLRQQRVLPWLRLTTRPVGMLLKSGVRPDGVDVEEWTIPLERKDISIRVAVDLLRPVPVGSSGPYLMCRLVEWRGILVRVVVDATSPQVATLAWYHEY